VRARTAEGHLRRGMWQTRDTPGQVLIKPQDGWNQLTGWNVKGPAIRAWAQTTPE